MPSSASSRFRSWNWRRGFYSGGKRGATGSDRGDTDGIMAPGLMPDDRRSLTIRLTAIQYIAAVMFSALAIAFWVFQIASHDRFSQMAENNHMRRLPLPAPRGVVFDRNGRILVENQSTFN